MTATNLCLFLSVAEVCNTRIREIGYHQYPKKHARTIQIALQSKKKLTKPFANPKKLTTFAPAYGNTASF